VLKVNVYRRPTELTSVHVLRFSSKWTDFA